MPLEPGKSSSAFGHNVKTEMAAGKPKQQAVAIAYSEQKRTGDDMSAGEGYAPIQGTVSSLAEMQKANERYYGQLEGETQWANTNDTSVDAPDNPYCKYDKATLNRLHAEAEKSAKYQGDPEPYLRKMRLIEEALKEKKVVDAVPAIGMPAYEETHARATDIMSVNTHDEHEGFEKVERSVAQEPRVKDPKAVAAAIGMKKYGKAGMEAKAQAGKDSAEELKTIRVGGPNGPGGQEFKIPSPPKDFKPVPTGKK